MGFTSEFVQPGRRGGGGHTVGFRFLRVHKADVPLILRSKASSMDLGRSRYMLGGVQA